MEKRTRTKVWRGRNALIKKQLHTLFKRNRRLRASFSGGPSAYWAPSHDHMKQLHEDIARLAKIVYVCLLEGDPKDLSLLSEDGE